MALVRRSFPVGALGCNCTILACPETKQALVIDPGDQAPDILAALKQLDDENDPPPRGGLAMRPPRFSKLDCTASEQPSRIIGMHAATRRCRSMPATGTPSGSRWTREANVRRYRKLLNTQLTDIERTFIERRLAEELQG